MNIVTRYARILMGYLTIGVVFAAAFSGDLATRHSSMRAGVVEVMPAEKPATNIPVGELAATPCPLFTFAKVSKQNCAVLSFRD